MKLSKITINKFRNFDRTQEILVNPYTVLIGPNNEGKSNIIDAITMFFSQTRFISRRSRLEDRNRFDITRDYPASHKSGRKWPTEISCKFTLDEIDHEECQLLKGKADITIIKMWNFESKRFQFHITGIDEKETNEIIEYVFGKVRVVTIPAIREIKNLESYITSIFRDTLEVQIEHSRRVMTLRNNLMTIINPEVEKVKRNINECLSVFLNTAKLDFEWTIDLFDSINITDLIIDDGIKTNINMKGDGIKNILLMALLTQYAEALGKNSDARHEIFLIEEPESHLNSAYLYSLRNSIMKISKKGTVICSTHSPVFVDFYTFKTNYLVMNNEIKNPKSKKEIADALGVKIQENLSSNYYALYVEGEEEVKALTYILQQANLYSKFIEICDIIPCYSASKIPTQVSTNYNLYEKHFILVDNDPSGLEAQTQLGKISSDVVVFVIPREQGYKEAELEDLLEVEYCAKVFSKNFSREISADLIKQIKKRNRTRWANYILQPLNASGLNINDADSLKGIIWSNEEKFEFTEDGKVFIDGLLKTIIKPKKT